ncbi:hypothetical protein GCM10022280_22030 [Sphingomonas swuensis]|uniref:Uncharacterized protein n=1 Tax=Sphingomonas swuensis TaxID=977800 RepID=A0ABP7T540_9SPHN
MGYRESHETEENGPEPAEGFARVGSDEESTAIEEARLFAKVGYYAVPVALIHFGLLYTVLRGALDLDIPDFTTSNPLLIWLWLNGAAVALAIWFWKRGHFPIRQGLWLRGRTAKLLIVLWLALSIAWFTLPAVLRRLGEVLLTRDW